ncbi:hypothetical protein T492DRAFT_968793 [Pavlovales sp. CCMP2436]|nr:hypothetical protein T492DRAFT_968793 [Pavlovales sp. CCMP2436]|mmetsp:Transcript_42836/g.105597  ORF Transcript_42836/g.105597 Transcript_42836/m.105597 type:complete len:183 (-) Transcript_42836:195-743(-)
MGGPRLFSNSLAIGIAAVASVLLAPLAAAAHAQPGSLISEEHAVDEGDEPVNWHALMHLLQEDEDDNEDACEVRRELLGLVRNLIELGEQIGAQQEGASYNVGRGGRVGRGRPAGCDSFVHGSNAGSSCGFTQRFEGMEEAYAEEDDDEEGYEEGYEEEEEEEVDSPRTEPLFSARLHRGGG